MNVDLFQWCTDVHFPSQPQAPQARAAFSTQVLFRRTIPSAVEVHRRYELAQCAMAAGYSVGPAPQQLIGSELRSGSRHAYEPGLGPFGYAQLGNGNAQLLGSRARCPAETNTGRREMK